MHNDDILLHNDLSVFNIKDEGAKAYSNSTKEIVTPIAKSRMLKTLFSRSYCKCLHVYIYNSHLILLLILLIWVENMQDLL